MFPWFWQNFLPCCFQELALAFAKALTVVFAEIFVMFCNFFENYCSESFCFLVPLMFYRDTYRPPWNFPQRIWICRSEFELAVVNLNLPWQILICCGEFEFAVANLKLPWWIWSCHRELEFELAAVNLNLPSEFEFAVVNLNLLW